jgi:hypothetical protein
MKFELKNLSRNATDDDIISEIKRVDSLVGKDFLASRDFDKYSKIHSTTIRNRWKLSWKDVLVKAGLGHKYSGPSFISEKVKSHNSHKLTDQEVIDELKNLAKKLGKEELLTEDVQNNSEIIGPGVVRSRFGSWKKAMEKAGLQVSIHGKRHSDEDYFENLLNVWTHYGRQPLYREMNFPPSKITVEGYRGRFGNFGKALEEFVSKMNLEDKEDLEQSLKTEEQKPQIQEKHKIEITPIEDKRSIPLSLRYKVLSRDNFKCVRCGRSPATSHGVELHIDHKLPFSMGGKTTLENLETKCKECNLGKSNRHSE